MDGERSRPSPPSALLEGSLPPPLAPSRSRSTLALRCAARVALSTKACAPRSPHARRRAHERCESRDALYIALCYALCNALCNARRRAHERRESRDFHDARAPRHGSMRRAFLAVPQLTRPCPPQGGPVSAAPLLTALASRGGDGRSRHMAVPRTWDEPLGRSGPTHLRRGCCGATVPPGRSRQRLAALDTPAVSSLWALWFVLECWFIAAATTPRLGTRDAHADPLRLVRRRTVAPACPISEASPTSY